jgi:hypothetical protein
MARDLRKPAARPVRPASRIPGNAGTAAPRNRLQHSVTYSLTANGRLFVQVKRPQHPKTARKFGHTHTGFSNCSSMDKQSTGCLTSMPPPRAHHRRFAAWYLGSGRGHTCPQGQGGRTKPANQDGSDRGPHLRAGYAALETPAETAHPSVGCMAGRFPPTPLQSDRKPPVPIQA